LPAFRPPASTFAALVSAFACLASRVRHPCHAKLRGGDAHPHHVASARAAAAT